MTLCMAGAIADVAAEGNVLRYRRVSLENGHSTDFQILLNLSDETVTTTCAPGAVVLTTLLDGAGALTGKEDEIALDRHARTQRRPAHRARLTLICRATSISR